MFKTNFSFNLFVIVKYLYSLNIMNHLVYSWNIIFIFIWLINGIRYNVLIQNHTNINRIFSKEDKIIDIITFNEYILYNVELTQKTLQKLNTSIISNFEKDDEVIIDSIDNYSHTIFWNSKISLIPFLKHFQLPTRPYGYSIFNRNFLRQYNIPWGLKYLFNGSYFEYFENAGTDVYVFILDTGLDIYHPEFNYGNRTVEFGIDITQTLKNNNQDVENPLYDDNGHGTHVAGIIGGYNIGIAKNVNLIGVKILDKYGKGTMFNIHKGIQYIIERVKKENLLKVVVNLSISGIKDKIINHKIKQFAAKYNIHFISAAGNLSSNGCHYSPGSSSQTITVGAINKYNEISLFSNRGSCVDIYAPGVNILSSVTNGQYKLMSGTSMAAPFVTGVVSLYLSLTTISPPEMKRLLLNDSVLINGIHVLSLVSLYNRLKSI